MSSLGFEANSLDGEVDLKKTENSFFARLFPEQAADEISFFNLNAVSEDDTPVAEIKSFFNHKSKQFFIQAPSVLSAPGCTRTSVVSLLELAENVSAKQVFIVMDKDHKNFAETARVFLYLGFTLVNPNVQQEVTAANDVALLGYSIEDEDLDE